MSLLTSLFSAPADEKRDWINDDDTWEGSITSSGARVTPDRAMRLSTVWACVRLLTNTISTLPMDIIVSIGTRRFMEFGKPTWMTTPDPADPTMTGTEHFAQVATSLLLDGNFFTYCPNTVLDPSVLIVLDPRRVNVKADGRSPMYEILDEMGRTVATVDSMKMLHGAWIKMPGALRGLSPIEAARQGIGLGLTAEEFGARFFGQGTTLSYGVEVPGPMTDDQRETLRANLKSRHAGTKNAHSVSVITSGAKFVTGLGITNEQAQFLELRRFQVEDIARWYGVPPHMVGSQEPGASSYNSVEQRSLEFREYAVLPLVRRIEDPYQRLVEVPDRLRDSNATAAMRFNLSALARADLKTRYESYSQGIMAGVLKPDEARSLEDLPPVPGGNVTYMQQQMVPLGTPPAQPPQPVAPPPPPEPRAAPIENHVHLSADTLRVEPPIIPPFPDIPVQPAPIVTVNVPAQPAPVVNVTIPEEQSVEKRVSRDAAGRIDAIYEKRGRNVKRVEVETDG